MTCVNVGMGVLCLSSESEPFLFNGKWYVVHAQCGPVAVDRHGDPLKNQPKGRFLQAAFLHYERARKSPPSPQCDELPRPVE